MVELPLDARVRKQAILDLQRSQQASAHFHTYRLVALSPRGHGKYLFVSGRELQHDARKRNATSPRGTRQILPENACCRALHLAEVRYRNCDAWVRPTREPHGG
jgi:hypothetical protein